MRVGFDRAKAARGHRIPTDGPDLNPRAARAFWAESGPGRRQSRARWRWAEATAADGTQARPWAGFFRLGPRALGYAAANFLFSRKRKVSEK